MKTLKLIVLGMMLLLASTVQAQVAVSVNIGTPPPWGPVGYEQERYYYLPDVEAYYDVNATMFIYNDGGAWVHRSHLPYRYRNYDLYGGYKVVMTGYHGDAPYHNHKEYKMKYAKGYHGEHQRTYHERPEKGHDEGRSHDAHHDNHKEYHGDNKGHDHSNDKGMKEDKGHGGEKHGKK